MEYHMTAKIKLNDMELNTVSGGHFRPEHRPDRDGDDFGRRHHHHHNDHDWDDRPGRRGPPRFYPL
jgi:hypothetical protein